MPNLRIALFISGRGSNMRAILENVKNGTLTGITPVVVVSDAKNAEGLATAKAYGVETYYLDCAPFKTKLEGDAEDRIITLLRKRNVDLICLAGFMRMVKTGLLTAFTRRIINIHPSLLPQFPGLSAQKQALEAGVAESGCTVHFVDAGMDTGPIIRQSRVPVRKDDTLETLSRRILQAEHRLYSEVLADIANERVAIGVTSV